MKRIRIRILESKNSLESLTKEVMKKLAEVNKDYGVDSRSSTEPIVKKLKKFLKAAPKKKAVAKKKQVSAFERPATPSPITFAGSGPDDKEEQDDRPDAGSSEEADQMALKRLEPVLYGTDKKHQELLLQHGFIPVHHLHDAELGSGAQGVVYEVTKGGKRYAAKISGSPSYFGRREIWDKKLAERELRVRTKVEKIRRRLPPEVAKHIVTTHSIIREPSYTVYIMEFVRPLTEDEKIMLYHGIEQVIPQEMEPDRVNYAFDNSYDDNLRRDLDSPVVKMFEKQRSFVSSLLYLKEKFNIEYKDLHGMNVMANMETGDYIATDIGFFTMS